MNSHFIITCGVHASDEELDSTQHHRHVRIYSHYYYYYYYYCCFFSVFHPISLPAANATGFYANLKAHAQWWEQELAAEGEYSH